MSAWTGARVSREKKTLKKGELGHLSVSLPSELLIALDKEADRMSKERGFGFVVTRSDVVKTALSEWLRQSNSK